jgi:NAD(P)-dependent dehydrogenase (short-subunit alcohol dehydrogenase family)
MNVNVHGVINMCQVFAPHMATQDHRSRIINTGSKQGITCPPGNVGHNVSKAAVTVYTEGRECLAFKKKCTSHSLRQYAMS